MEKQKQTVLVHGIGLGERQRASHKAAQALTQNVVEPFNMACLPCTFTPCAMLLFGQNLCIGRPKVREQNTPFVALRNTLP